MGIIILIFLAAIATALLNNSSFLDRKKKQDTRAHITINECKDIIDKALVSLNCKAEWTSAEHGFSCTYVYQSGFFRLNISDDSRYVNMGYMYMFETSVSNLDIIRNLCNYSNKRSENENFVYSVNGEKNVADVHILSRLTVTREDAEEVLREEMTNIFGCRNNFYNEFGRMMNEKTATELTDIEQHVAESTRKNFLVHEHELFKTPRNIRFRENNYDNLLISTFIRKVLSNETIKINALTVCADENNLTKISDAGEISAYHLSDSIFKNGRKVNDESTIIVKYCDSSLPGFSRTILLHISYEGGGSKTMYYRVTVMQVPVTYDDVHNSGDVVSLTVAYDTNEKKQDYYEFLYLWKEAKEKKNNGSELNDEEQLISYTDEEKYAYRLFKARRLFLEHRYYEALPYLVNVYRYLSNDYPQLRNNEMISFYEVCFMLGTSYCDMKDYDRALPYLVIVLDAENIGVPLHEAIKYKKEYVNCLVNSHDFRAVKYVYEMIATIEQAEHFRNLSQPWNDFLKFLRRSQVRLMLDNLFVEDAEAELKKMLDDPDNKDFALNQLAYIQKIKKKTDE